LDGENVVFGRVVDGFDVLKELNEKYWFPLFNDILDPVTI
jgi:cyclophilin family peptidyl-prolyl cis-trans isomerase